MPTPNPPGCLQRVTHQQADSALTAAGLGVYTPVHGRTVSDGPEKPEAMCLGILAGRGCLETGLTRQTASANAWSVVS